jgi:hypothetical protein
MFHLSKPALFYHWFLQLIFPLEKTGEEKMNVL